MTEALKERSYLLLPQSTVGNQKFQLLSEDTVNRINQLWEKPYHLSQSEHTKN